jgi:hypothetical protein
LPDRQPPRYAAARPGDVIQVGAVGELSDGSFRYRRYPETEKASRYVKVSATTREQLGLTHDAVKARDNPPLPKTAVRIPVSAVLSPLMARIDTAIQELQQWAHALGETAKPPQAQKAQKALQATIHRTLATMQGYQRQLQGAGGQDEKRRSEITRYLDEQWKHMRPVYGDKMQRWERLRQMAQAMKQSAQKFQELVKNHHARHYHKDRPRQTTSLRENGGVIDKDAVAIGKDDRGNYALHHSTGEAERYTVVAQDQVEAVTLADGRALRAVFDAQIERASTQTRPQRIGENIPVAKAAQQPRISQTATKVAKKLTPI